MPPRDRTQDLRYRAEDRYASYQRELKDLLNEAEGLSHRGLWDEAALKLNSCLMTLGAMSGVARELNVLYLIAEER